MTSLTHYCTYFDHRYLPRGLALHASMRRHCEPFCLWVLCLSDQCHAILTALALPGLVPLRLQDLEAYDHELRAAKSTRTIVEYYFTCTPALSAWLLATRPEIEVLTYLDSDLFFFHSPNFMFDEFKSFSALLVPHNFTPRNKHLLKTGIYNVGWVSFRKDSDGLAAVQWWRRSCIEWCRFVIEEDRFADQKYLDQLAARFNRVLVVRHPGVDLAAWNLDNFRISAGPDGAPKVDDVSVIFFHFARVRRVTSFLWGTNHRHLGAPMGWRIRSLLYAPYLREVMGIERMLRQRHFLRAVPLEYRKAPIERGPLWSTLREIAALAVRGGGIWVFGNRFL